LLNQTNTFPKSNPQLHLELYYYSLTPHALNLKFSLFILIQIISGLINNKTILVKQIFSITGIYEKTHPDLKTLRLICLIFLTTLVVDRSTIFDKKESISSDVIHSILYPNQISTKMFFSFFPFDLKNDPSFEKIITKIASIHQDEDDYIFRLKNLTLPNIYSPHIDLSKALQHLTRHSEKFPKKVTSDSRY
jgi:hypothetical protein